MDSGMIGKIQKAKRYAEERDRIHFSSFTVTFDGTNNPHTVKYENGQWIVIVTFSIPAGVAAIPWRLK